MTLKRDGYVKEVENGFKVEVKMCENEKSWKERKGDVSEFSILSLALYLGIHSSFMHSMAVHDFFFKNVKSYNHRGHKK